MRISHFAMLILGAAAVRMEQKAPVSVGMPAQPALTMDLQIVEALKGDPTEAQVKELIGEIKAATPVALPKFISIVMAWGQKYDVSPPNKEAEERGPKKFLTKVFKEADTDHDGKLSAAELMKALEGEG